MPIKKLEEVVVFKDNLRKPITSNERIEGPYPYYGANGIQGYVNDFIFDEELVLLAEDGGHFYEPDRGIAYKVNGKSWVNNHAHVLSPKSNIDINYLWRVLENLDIKEYVNGTTRAKLTKSNALQIKIPLPPLAEQKRIADILDKANEIKSKRELALSKLDELAQSTFIEMFGDFDTNTNQHQIKNFNDLIIETKLGLVRGASELDPSNEYPYLRMNAITNNGDLQLNKLMYAKASTSEVREFSLKKYDFLFNTRNSKELVGKTAIFLLDGSNYLFNNNIMRIRFKNIANPQYISYAFKTKYIQNQLENIKSGTTNVFAIYYKDLKNIQIPLPELVDQNAFASKIEALDLLKEKFIKNIDVIKNLNYSLQNQAFTTGFNA